MLKALTIENFKAFGEPARIEFAPITLIYGQNSAGKSSILQALNLLKQTHEKGDSAASLLPRAENGIVDLGSFRELLFDHDQTRVLRIKVDASPMDPRRVNQAWRRFMPEPPESLALAMGFGYAPKSREVQLLDLAVSIGPHHDAFARFRTRHLSDREQRDARRMIWSAVRSRQRGTKRLFGAECEWVSEAPEQWEPMYRAWHNRRSDIRNMLVHFRDEVSSHWRVGHSVITEDVPADQEQKAVNALTTAINFYSQSFTRDQLVERFVEGWRGSMLHLDGFLPVGGGSGTATRLPELEVMDMRYRPQSTLNLPTNDVATLSVFAGKFLEETLNALFPMGPFRRPPERLYIFTGTSPEDVGHKGDHLPDLLFRRPDLVEHANRWLRKLEIGYQLRVKSIGERDTDLFEVRLVDTRRTEEVEVGLSDVGFGLSQILPFLVQSLASEEQIISIEQPEVHIHPRLQADLGELIAECTKDPFNHQFLIETHSEHLVLRLQRLVRARKLKPSDISVLFVERGPCGSRVKRLQLDDSGEFIDEWPGGFFPERMRELI